MKKEVVNKANKEQEKTLCPSQEGTYRVSPIIYLCKQQRNGSQMNNTIDWGNSQGMKERMEAETYFENRRGSRFAPKGSSYIYFEEYLDDLDRGKRAKHMRESIQQYFPPQKLLLRQEKQKKVQCVKHIDPFATKGIIWNEHGRPWFEKQQHKSNNDEREVKSAKSSVSQQS